MKVITLNEQERLSVIAPKREILSPSEVLEIIAPVDPDGLYHEGGGVYLASWGTDGREACEGIARLANMLPRVVVLSEAPFKTVANPRGLAIVFAVIPLTFEEVETVQ